MHAPPATRPWSEAPTAHLARVHGVFTDIDDTLTRDGAIEPVALTALLALHAAGVPVVAVTGRPLGWSEPFVRPGPQAWPVRAIVAESGAVALIPEGGRLLIEFAQDAAVRQTHAVRLREVAAQIVDSVPGAVLAQDSAGRATDIAIDHSEFARLDAPAIARIVALMQAVGMNATVSSIHINGWFGAHTKFTAAQWMLQRLFGRRLDNEIDRWVAVGDSTNDQPMFSRFPLAVGVANLLQFADRLQHWPAYLTLAERGAGFAEVARRLLAARGAPAAAAQRGAASN